MEIYNAPELRVEPEKRGVKFQTDHSDTEVALQLYALLVRHLFRN